MILCRALAGRFGISAGFPELPAAGGGLAGGLMIWFGQQWIFTSCAGVTQALPGSKCADAGDAPKSAVAQTVLINSFFMLYSSEGLNIYPYRVMSSPL